VHVDWDGSLDTGDQTIDAQHRAIVALCEHLTAAEKDGPDEVRRVLDQLTEYVAVHFALEQDLMEREAYPAEDRAEHVAEHESMTRLTRQQVLDYRTGRLTSVAPMREWLDVWIRRHVVEMDGRLAEHIRRRAAEQA
jgi:hemerythrin-like metal-binding protein